MKPKIKYVCTLIKGFAAKFGFDELCKVRYLAQHTNLHGTKFYFATET